MDKETKKMIREARRQFNKSVKGRVINRQRRYIIWWIIVILVSVSIVAYSLNMYNYISAAGWWCVTIIAVKELFVRVSLLRMIINAVEIEDGVLKVTADKNIFQI